MATTGPTLWPGLTTFPNTNVYPGQGEVPFIRCRISTDDYSVATRAWTDMSSRLRGWQVDRGRANELQEFDAGTATIVLENRDRQLDPALHPEVRPMNKVWLCEEFSAEVRDLFVGYAEAYVQSWPDGGWSNALTTVRAADEFKAMAWADIPSGTSFTNVTAGTRGGGMIAYALTQASIGRVPRLLDFGQVNHAGYVLPADTNVGSFVQLIAASDGSGTDSGTALFIDAGGTIRFYDAAHRAGLSVSATFDDDGTDLPYTDLVIDYSDSFLFNSVTVTDGTSSSFAEDATSIGQYGKRSHTFTVYPQDPRLPIHFTLLYKDPKQRIIQITPNMSDLETMRVCFARELLDKVEILRTPPGGGARIDQVSYIQNIAWQGEPGELPSCILGVSPL